jgi:hypothetical protein
VARHTESIKKLRELRDGVKDAIDIIRPVEEPDVQIAVAMLETIYVSADLAIDKPCGCGDKK